jgi:ABC-2 type transport system permease protein
MFNEGLPCDLPIAVIDNDNSSLSREFIRQVNVMQMVDVKEKYDSFAKAESEMKKGNIYAFVIIPANMQADVLAGRQPELTFYYSNAFFVPGSLLFKDLNVISVMTSSAVNLTSSLARGKTESEIMGQLQPIVVDAHLVGNPQTNYSVYLSNVIIPGILQLMILFLTTFSTVSEIKSDTSVEWLRKSGNSIMKALAGKLFPYTVIFSFLLILNNFLLFKVMHFPLAGSFAVTVAASILLVLAEQALGIFIAGLVPILSNALSFSAVIGLLGISLTGFTFPVEQMFLPVQPLSELFPLRHFFRIYQNNALNGAPIEYYWHYFLRMMLFLFLPFVVMVRLKKAMLYRKYEKK